MDELHDPELGRILGRASGANPDVNTALAAMHGRVRQVRRRRVALAATATCGVLLAGATLAMLRSGDAGTGRDAPADRGTPLVASDVSVSDPTEPTTTGADAPASSSVPDDTATVTTPQPGATTTAGGPGQTASPVTMAVATAPTTARPTTVAPAADVVRTFAGTGGSITVRLHQGTLTLVSATPATGFTVAADALTGGSRVEVRFTSADHQTRIRVDVVAGQLDDRVDESGHGKG